MARPRNETSIRRALKQVIAGDDGGFTPALLKQSVVTGGADNAELTCTGITAADTIVGAIQLDLEASEKFKGIVDITSKVTPKAGKIKVSGATTTGDQILVTWYKEV